MKTCTTIFLFLMLGSLNAQPTTEWIAVYSGLEDDVDKPHEMAVNEQGEIYICGESGGSYADWMTIKYDTAGNLLWDNRYNGAANDGEECYGIAVDKWGNAIVCGFSFELFGNSQFFTIAYDNIDGHTLWSNAVPPFWEPTECKARDVKIDTAGNSYVTGFVYNGSAPQGTGNDWLTVSYQPLGVERWLDLWYPSEDILTSEYAYALQVTPAGTVYMVGETYIDDIKQICTRKFNYYGADWIRYYDFEAWTLEYPYPKIAIAANEDVYVAANFKSGDEMDALLLKYDSLGYIQWSKTYNGPSNLKDFSVDLAVDNDENIILLVQSENDSPGIDMVTIKYNPQGDVLWTNIYEQGYMRPKAMALDKMNNIYVSGGGITTVKYNPDGNEEWVENYYEGSEPRDIIVDQHSNVYVTGYFSNGIQGLDICTIKYSQEISDISDHSYLASAQSILYQNYPNPFHSYTIIKYKVPEQNTSVTIKVFDALGNEITTLVDEKRSSGQNEVFFNGSDLQAGIYYYQLTVGDHSQTRKMIIIK